MSAVRKATIEDVEQITSVHMRSRIASYKAEINQIENELGYRTEFSDRWKKRITSDKHIVYLLERDSKVEVVVSISLENTPLLSHLYVDPSCWGMGHGTTLFQAIIPLLPEASKLNVWVLKNTEAEKFYQKMGFISTGNKEEKVCYGNKLNLRHYQIKSVSKSQRLATRK